MTSFPTLPDNPPERPNLEGAPLNPVLILRTGQRVPIGLRRMATRVFAPIIEGDLAKLLPLVIGIDAEYWPAGTSFRFPTPKGMDGQAWAQQLLDNSPCLRAGSSAFNRSWEVSK